MTQMRVREAAALLGVSDDTVRRWIDRGHLAASTSSSGRKLLDGADVARLAREQAPHPSVDGERRSSARNRFTGLVTRVVSDTVMAQVEMQCGPFRVVSLMSREAVEELGLQEGSVASAMVKATQVVVETPEREDA